MLNNNKLTINNNKLPVFLTDIAIDGIIGNPSLQVVNHLLLIYMQHRKKCEGNLKKFLRLFTFQSDKQSQLALARVFYSSLHIRFKTKII